MTTLELELLAQVAGGRTAFGPETDESPNHPAWRRRVRALEQLHARGYISEVLTLSNTRTNEDGFYTATVNGGIREAGQQALNDAQRDLDDYRR